MMRKLDSQFDRAVMLSMGAAGTISAVVALLTGLGQTDLPWQSSVMSHLLYSTSMFSTLIYVWCLQRERNLLAKLAAKAETHESERT